MVWAAQRRLLAEPCIIHENVEGFDPAVLVQLLGDMYLIFSVFCELMRLVIPCRRKRRIAILVHKHMARATIPWDYKCIELCELHCALTFNNFMLSRQDEFQNQLNWASTRDALAKDSEYKDDEDVKVFIFVENLTCTELLDLRVYRRKWPKTCFMLGQDATAVPNHSSRTVLQCRTKSQGPFMFSDCLQRWLMPRELLALQGYRLRAMQATWGAYKLRHTMPGEFGLVAPKGRPHDRAVRQCDARAFDRCCHLVGLVIHISGCKPITETLTASPST